jgi:hypothetical protein
MGESMLKKPKPRIYETHVYSVTNGFTGQFYFRKFRDAKDCALQIRKAGGTPETSYVPVQSVSGEIL